MQTGRGNGCVGEGLRMGEATLLLRYQGTLTTLPVTVLNPKPGFVWKPLLQNNYIDRAVDAKLQRLKVQPSPPWTTPDFCGVSRWISPASCPRPKKCGLSWPMRQDEAQQRDRKLIASPAYVDHWTLKWGDLLQNSRKYLGEKGAFEFREWIRENIEKNKPYDHMVREMLESRGSFLRESRGEFPARHARPQAHHGEDYAGVSGRPHGVRRSARPSVRALDTEPVLRNGGVLFGGGDPARVRSRRRRLSSISARIFRHEAPQGRPRHEPEIHSAGGLDGRGSRATDQRRRLAYAEWVTAKDNPFFAKSTVNRVWSYFFGPRHHRPRGRHSRVESAQ